MTTILLENSEKNSDIPSKVLILHHLLVILIRVCHFMAQDFTFVKNVLFE
jgi:hypothetical protein